MSPTMLKMMVTDDMSIEDRVLIVAPILSRLIDEWDEGKSKMTVQPFQQLILDLIDASGLSYMRWCDTDKVGVHPSNREEAGLVPIDVHELLLRIVLAGWSWPTCDCLATEIPPTSEGGKWRAFNTVLAEGSDGLLAPVNAGMLELLTVRGSHTTAGIRCVQHGAKGVDSTERLCRDGCISRARVLEIQPSMAEPLQKGLPYLTLKWQLVVSCPKLMSVLSRTGNWTHGVAREETALQSCKRIHAISAKMQIEKGEVDWDVVAQQACVGKDPLFAERVSHLCDFVMAWSGGADGHILKNLEAYERTLPVKRSLNSKDLSMLGKVDFLEGSRYATAMVKAMLNAPSTMVANGQACVFGTNDFASVQPKGRNRSNAIEANNIITAASRFFEAYGSRVASADRRKLLVDLEIRCVMHVHHKRTDTRAMFNSLLHIAKQFHSDMKMLDSHVPKWPLLADLNDEAPSTGATPAKACVTPAKACVKRQGLREVLPSGEVADSVLESHGFVVGAVVAKRDGETAYDKYEIKSLQPSHALLWPNGAQSDDEGEELEVARLLLLREWVTQKVVVTEATRL